MNKAFRIIYSPTEFIYAVAVGNGYDNVEFFNSMKQLNRVHPEFKPNDLLIVTEDEWTAITKEDA